MPSTSEFPDPPSCSSPGVSPHAIAEARESDRIFFRSPHKHIPHLCLAACLRGPMGRACTSCHPLHSFVPHFVSSPLSSSQYVYHIICNPSRGSVCNLEHFASLSEPLSVMLIGDLTPVLLSSPAGPSPTSSSSAGLSAPTLRLARCPTASSRGLAWELSLASPHTDECVGSPRSHFRRRATRPKEVRAGQC